MDFSLTPEQMAFQEEVVKFCKRQIAPHAEESDREGKFCWEAWKKMGEFGLLGLPFPSEYGGGDSDVLTAVLAGEAMGRGGADGGLLLSWGAHTYLCGDTILKNGTEEQKKKYLPRIASGEWVGAMGLTEPDAGSDAAAIRTTALRKGDGYVLNGTKMFITNGPIADVICVYATMNRELKHMGISGFIVEKGYPGFSVGKKLNKMGVRSSTTSELIFEDCQVPRENLLGQEGQGFLAALGTLEWDRSALLAPTIGGFQLILEQCARYAKDRRQFGRPIAEFQAIQHKLADIKVFVEALRLLIYRVAWYKDQGRPLNHLEAAIAKLMAGDWGMQCASEAVQIHGGYGYIHEYPAERLFRDTKLGSIGGGTSEIQKTIIARMMRG
ncbi:MAG: acyl-CoA dehydrogenase family protein [bacterium]